jgi:hypothetical protein
VPLVLQASGPFAERWVYGRGVPNFTLGFSFKAKTNTCVWVVQPSQQAAITFVSLMQMPYGWPL